MTTRSSGGNLQHLSRRFNDRHHGALGALANMLRRTARDVEGGPPLDAEQLAKDAANAHRANLKMTQRAIETARPSDILGVSFVQNVYRHLLNQPMASSLPEDVSPLSERP
jgi:hypothetical protein